MSVLRAGLAVPAVVLACASLAAAAPVDAIFDSRGMVWTDGLKDVSLGLSGLGCVGRCVSGTELFTVAGAVVEVRNYPVYVVEVRHGGPVRPQNVSWELPGELLDSFPYEGPLVVETTQVRSALVAVPEPGSRWHGTVKEIAPTVWASDSARISSRWGTDIDPKVDGARLIPSRGVTRGDQPAGLASIGPGYLIIFGSTVSFPGASREVLTGTDSGGMTEVPGASWTASGTVNRTVLVVHFLELAGPSFGKLTPWASSLEGTLSGTAKFEDVALSSAVNGSALQTEASISTLTGNLSLLGQWEDGKSRWHAQGDAAHFTIDNDIVFATASEVVGSMVAGVGIVAIALETLRRLLLAALRSRADPLEHPARLRLLADIQQTPGATLEALRQGHGLGRATARFHLHVLVRGKFAISEAHGRSLHFFPVVQLRSTQFHPVLQHPIRSALYRLAGEEAGTAASLADRVKPSVSRELARHHLACLVSHGLLRRGHGRQGIIYSTPILFSSSQRMEAGHA